MSFRSGGRWARCAAILLATAIAGPGVGRALAQNQTPAPTGQQPPTQTQDQRPSDATPPTGQQPGQTNQGQNILDLDLESLSRVNVRPQTTATPTSTGNILTPSAADMNVAPTSVGDLLEQAPSVSLRRTSALNLDPRVRGFHSGELNASADGMTQLKTRIDIDSLFSQINPGFVQSLEVIDGPYTSLYGPGFAFLNAELLTPPRYTDGIETHGSTRFSHGTNGRQIYNLERLWGGGEDWGYQLAYGLRVGNDYRTGNSGYDARVPASYRTQDVLFSFSGDLTANSRLEFDYIRQDMWDVELPGIAYDVRRGMTDQFNVRYVLQDRLSGPEQFVIQYWNQRTPYNGDNFNESKRRTFSDVLIGQPFPNTLGGALINNGISKSSGVRFLSTLGDVDTIRWTSGADWRLVEQFYREIDFMADGEIAFGGNTFGIPRSSLQDIGIFTHLTNPITKEFSVSVGGRFDHINPFLDVGNLATFLGPDFTLADVLAGTEQKSHYLGMGYVAADYQASKWLRVNAGAGYAMRNPNLAELYSAEPFVPLIRFGNSYVDGNSDLDSEGTIQFDVGVTGTWKRGMLRARAFHNTIYDYIMPVPSNVSSFVEDGVPTPQNLNRNYAAFDPPPVGFNLQSDAAALAYRYSNIDQVALWGTEFSGEYKLREWLAVVGSVAYVRGSNLAPVRFDAGTLTLIPLPFTEPLPGIYPLNSTFGVRIFEPRANKWSFETLVRMVARQDRVASSLAELPTAGFTVVGLQGSYQVSESVRLFSSIENLFDRPYTQHGSLAIVNPGGAIDFVKEPGFSWFVGLEARF